jgi:pimeloyl-ACP methyl ester carboxylesterase
MDASTADLMKDAFYPEYLSDDALAAMEFLRHRERIDSKYVGAWGSSEGGMLATQIAPRSNDVAFAINSSGFMGPLWQTFRYQAELILRKSKNSAAAVQEELALIDMWFDVGRTGKGWEKFEALRDKVVNRDGSWFYQSMATSYEQTRWFWTHTLSFDPLPALKHVRCPVLGVFGELDPFTDAANASENMRRVLSEAGHRDFTIKVFPNAGHSLSVMPSKDRMAPGVFDTLRSWLLARVRSERHH